MKSAPLFYIFQAGITLNAYKSLTGKILKDKECTFVLTDESGNTVDAVNDANGMVKFSLSGLNTVGEYVLKLREVKGDDAQITYDENTCLAFCGEFVHIFDSATI